MMLQQPQEEVEVSRKEFFYSKDKNWYEHRIKKLTESWFQMVQHDRLNFE